MPARIKIKLPDAMARPLIIGSRRPILRNTSTCSCSKAASAIQEDLVFLVNSDNGPVDDKREQNGGNSGPNEKRQGKQRDSQHGNLPSVSSGLSVSFQTYCTPAATGKINFEKQPLRWRKCRRAGVDYFAADGIFP